ncbi:hypothetical protein Poli38472_013052 [Pythium oligandrum]|uniref:M-phase phosphoprotein 6 n=1 Tax=Pythium oligandrum TaxID=41045 RepID=A0A8K1CKP3_PYTOL|nr:hypothetical protein Poli38472_013052 [Pythium oligandrum]|eukprot:TMW64430.1 hypothetical protein Poli38472_013052 [Pythium oligandrum]
MWKPGTQKPQATPPAAASKSESVKSNEARSTTKSALSQKTLAMKFMQRKKTAADQKRNALEEQKKKDTWVLEEADKDSDRIVCTRDVPDPSLPPIFGRRSFGGFNKAIEDEYREMSRQLKYAASEERELRDEVSAEEMTSRMVKYTGLLRGGGGNGAMRSKKRPRKA